MKPAAAAPPASKPRAKQRPAVPKKTDPASQSSARREAIVRAALRVLQQDGYAALTARKIAAEAEMSLGHISYHFTNMDEVMSEAYRLASKILQETEARLPQGEGSARERFAALLRAGFTDDILNPAYLRMRIDLWSAALTRPEIAKTEAELYHAYRTRLAGLLTQMAHYSRADRVPAVCDVIMATMDGLWLDWMRRRDRGAVDRGLELVQKLATLELS
jgi:TetR/AcrR family transcriptional repressor of bet genes